jgi:hypothetical protein
MLEQHTTQLVGLVDISQQGLNDTLGEKLTIFYAPVIGRLKVRSKARRAVSKPFMGATPQALSQLLVPPNKVGVRIHNTGCASHALL